MYSFNLGYVSKNFVTIFKLSCFSTFIQIVNNVMQNIEN